MVESPSYTWQNQSKAMILKKAKVIISFMLLFTNFLFPAKMLNDTPYKMLIEFFFSDSREV